MQMADPLARKYEELANGYARAGEARSRDQCFVLAADAALNAGLPDQAERVRKRLLGTNPHHLLRPFSSMAEAMQSSDVRDYVADLRRQWPPESVEKLLRHRINREDVVLPQKEFVSAPVPVVGQEEAPASLPVAPVRSHFAQQETASSGTNISLAATLVFLLGVMLAGGFLFFALGGPLMG